MNDWCLEYVSAFVVVGTRIVKSEPTMAAKECGHHMHIRRLNDVDVGIVAVRICLKRDRLLNHINNSIYFISSQRRVRGSATLIFSTRVLHVEKYEHFA